MNNGPIYRTIRKHLIDRSLKPTHLAGDALYYLAASPEVEGITGRYYNMTHSERPGPHALNRSLGRTLWMLSEQLTGLVQPAPGTA